MEWPLCRHINGSIPAISQKHEKNHQFFFIFHSRKYRVYRCSKIIFVFVIVHIIVHIIFKYDVEASICLMFPA